MNQQFSINPDLVKSIEDLIHSNLMLAAKKFAEVYHLDEKEIVKTCIPKLTIKSDLDGHNNKMTALSKINKIDQLHKIKVTDIKYYLQHFELKISGKKDILVERLWNYLQDKEKHKELSESELVKPSKKKKCFHIVDMSEPDEIGEYLDIYLDKDRPIANVINGSGGTKYYLDVETNYVSEMSEEDKQLYYVGYLAEDGKTVDFQHGMDIDI
jgi:hypothetical protein